MADLTLYTNHHDCIKIADVPSTWRMVLDVAREVAPGACIAGGALRDLDHGKTPKDVDIFFSASSGPDFAYLMMEMGNRLGVKLECTQQTWDEYRTRNGLITGVTPFKYQGVSFELIGMDPEHLPGGSAARIDHLNVTETFDFGLCKISTDGNSITTAGAYRTDKSLKQFTHLHNFKGGEPGMKRSFQRWFRFREKYPTYPMVLTQTWDFDGPFEATKVEGLEDV